MRELGHKEVTFEAILRGQGVSCAVEELSRKRDEQMKKSRAWGLQGTVGQNQDHENKSLIC